jgi:hypothetical protein
VSEISHACLQRVAGIALVGSLALAGCGGGGSGAASVPSIHIDVPTLAATYATTSTDVRLGGTVSGASFVHVRNALTGLTTEGYVIYSQGAGSWFADVAGLGFGDNPITVTADADGTGASTAQAHITVSRPLQPASLVTNGSSEHSSDTYWTDASSFGGAHAIALFADGTGRSTTGSTLADSAGAVANVTWSSPGADSIVIIGCPNCSFQTISRISGSFGDGTFYGQVVTTGGAGDSSLDVFVLSSGSL